jgi:hypothetical protein
LIPGFRIYSCGIHVVAKVKKVFVCLAKAARHGAAMLHNPVLECQDFTSCRIKVRRDFASIQSSPSFIKTFARLNGFEAL